MLPFLLIVQLTARGTICSVLCLYSVHAVLMMGEKTASCSPIIKFCFLNHPCIIVPIFGRHFIYGKPVHIQAAT